MFARVTGALGGILLPAGAALAQQEYESVPLSYKEVSTTIPWVIGAVFVVATLVVAFKPAKRSNLK
jgi:hypothetical protein